MYNIDYKEQALLDIAKLKKGEPAAYKKVVLKNTGSFTRSEKLKLSFWS